MAELDSIISITITALTKTISRQGFGTPLIAAFFSTGIFPERVRSYSSVTAAVADGFSINDPVMRALGKILGQNPHPPTVKIGRRALAYTQAGRITPTDTTEGLVNSFNVVSPDGTVTAITYTNGPAETVAGIVAALQALVNAISDLGATDDTTHMSWDADNPGELFDFNSLTNILDILDETPDPGIATDIGAIQAEDDDWYALLLDSNSKAEIAAAAAIIEAVTKIFLSNSADAEVKNDVGGNIQETLNAASRARSTNLFSGSILSYAAAAWAGKVLPFDPGSATWAFKTLAGVVADSLSTTQIANIESNKGNHYLRIAGRDITRQGTMADGEFIDVRRTIDALEARIQEDLFVTLANLPKLAFTDSSVSLVKGLIRGAIRSFQDDNALDPESDPTVTAPLVADVSAADRAGRLLPDVEFEARLAGAIHQITIQGILTI